MAMRCREYADFRVSSDGEVQGVGLLIAADPSNGKLVVLAPIMGGPADRAGIRPGDEVETLSAYGTGMSQLKMNAMGHFCGPQAIGATCA